MTSDKRSRRRFLAALGTAAAAGIAGCSTGNGSDGTTTDGPGTDTPRFTTSTPQTLSDPIDNDSTYTEVYEQTIDSVVLVRVYGADSGQGSGFVYDGQHVVTNQHVVDGADEIEVRFAGGEWRPATIVGTDVYSDLAVIQVEDKPDYATPMTLLSGDPPIGTEVVALGNPFGLGGSISAGIVSGVNRSLPGANDFVIPDAIQTDAAVNPGNSGGPLVTLDGRVVGVINSGGGDNIGFAISAALIRRVVPSLVETGDYDHPYMGVRLTGVTPTIAEGNDLEEVRGVIIVEVFSGTPSDGVLRGSPDSTVINGVQVPVGGDVVLRMGGQPVIDQSALSTYLALNTSPGETIPVEILRDGERMTVDLTLGTRPEP